MPNAIYDPTRTYLLDISFKNYLVRGNEPLNEDSSFSYDELNTKLQMLLINPDFNLADYKLIDMSLIDNNPASEGSDLQLEFKAFGFSSVEFTNMLPFPAAWPPVYQKIDVTKQYGSKIQDHPGSIIWYPTQGCSDPDNCRLVEPTQFDFVGQVELLRKLILSEERAVIYFHCEHGHDRTSALAAAYMIKYMHKTLDEVLTQKPPAGAKAFDHPWEPNYEQLVRYYASVQPTIIH